MLPVDEPTNAPEATVTKTTDVPTTSIDIQASGLPLVTEEVPEMSLSNGREQQQDGQSEKAAETETVTETETEVQVETPEATSFVLKVNADAFPLFLDEEAVTEATVGRDTSASRSLPASTGLPNHSAEGVAETGGPAQPDNTLVRAKLTRRRPLSDLPLHRTSACTSLHKVQMFPPLSY